jgi:hypothetical protein
MCSYWKLHDSCLLSNLPINKSIQVPAWQSLIQVDKRPILDQDEDE